MNRRVVGLLTIGIAVALGAAPVQAQEFQERSTLLNERLSPIARSVTGGAMIDYNADGLVDIYREGLLQTQVPNGRFRNLKGPSGIDDLNGRTAGGVWGDYDLDGFPDLFLIDRSLPPKVFKNLGRWFFARADRSLALDDVPPSTSAVWFDGNSDGTPDLAVTGDFGTRVYTGRLGSPFVLRSSISGTPGCGLTAYDYDGDRDMDLYQSSCQEGQSVDRFLQNGGIGQLTEDQDVLAARNGRLATGAVYFDFDRDGDLDLFVANGIALPPAEFATASDRLYRNDGGGTFSPMSDTGDLPGGDFEQSWGVAAADFDNDGWVDLYVSNEGASTDAASQQSLLRNNGDGTFTDIATTSLPLDISAESVPITGDLNGDGHIDIYMAAQDGDRIFYNQGNDNHWLRVQLRNSVNGGEAFGSGFGAKVSVWTNGSVQGGQVSSGTGQASQHDGLTAHFGLGSATQADSVIVHWISGATDRLGPIEADQDIVIEEGGATGRVPGTFGLIQPSRDERIDLSDGAINFLWEELSDDSGAVTYDLTIAGPAVDTTFAGISGTSVTVNPDFLLQQQTYFWTVTARTRFVTRSATSRGQFRFGGTSVAAPLTLIMPLRSLSSGQLALSDYDGDGDLDLALTGATEQGGETRVYAAVDSLFPTDLLDQPFKLYEDTNSILRDVRDSHVSWADYDGDGDEDLFVAGYFEDVDGNVSIESDLYENDGVLRQNAPISSGITNFHQGDADWADFDGDGDLDILIAGALNPDASTGSIATVVRNDNGQFQALDLGMTGVRFATVAWVDYDSDGDPDAFVTGQVEDGAAGTFAYRNDAGSFTLVELGLPGLLFGSMDWADYDNDGDPDLLINGGVLSPELYTGRSFVYRNDGGTFTDIGADRDLSQIVFGMARWLDYDQDGDQDILLSGVENPFGERVALVYRNEDNVRFAEEFRLSGLMFASIAAGDYNGDGDQDFMAVGEDENGEASVLFFVNLLFAEPIPAALIQR